MKDRRLAALYRFGFAITLLNVLGHTVLGFEQSWAQPLVALATAYTVEILLEAVDAWANRRRPRFAGGFRKLGDHLIAAHITGLAVSMLLYANDRLFPIAFATAVAVGSKAVFQVPVKGRKRHFFNPSNIGITATLLLFPWVGIAPPYHFTENLTGGLDWALPAVIIVSGSFLNGRFTGRVPLILAWVGGFVLQATLRSLLFGTPLVASLNLMTGVAFVLFTFYMVSDPGTTPFDRRGQVGFGAGVAGAYGFLMAVHVVFGLFFALTIVCALRGVKLQLQAWAEARSTGAEETPRRLTESVPLTAESVAAYRSEKVGARR